MLDAFCTNGSSPPVHALLIAFFFLRVTSLTDAELHGPYPSLAACNDARLTESFDDTGRVFLQRPSPEIVGEPSECFAKEVR
jgi:hypothetical protein